MEPAAKKLRLRHNYNSMWEHDLAICEIGDTVLCVLCGQVFTCMHRSNLVKHHTKQHPTFIVNFPINSVTRAQEIKNHKQSYENRLSKEAVIHTDSATSTLVSYIVSYEIAKSLKPYQEGEFIKDVVLKVTRALFRNLDAEDQIVKTIENIPLSRRTITRRVNDISCDITSQLYADLERCVYFSLQLDESTDISDTPQLIIFTRIVFDDLSFKEELLTLLSLQTTTTATDIFEKFMEFVSIAKLPISKLVAITTDGAPAMIGRHNEFIALCRKNKVKDTNENTFPHFLSFHCIIHQQTLCAKVLPVDDVVELVNKIVKSILAKPLDHRIYRTLAKDNNPDVRDLMFFTEVRWLSKGIMMERFYENIEEIYKFLQNKETEYNLQASQCSKLVDIDWLTILAYTVDLLQVLNRHNKELQGKNKLIWDQLTTIENLEMFLTIATEMFEKNIIDDRFPRLKKIYQTPTNNVQLPGKKLSGFTSKLLQEFNRRFQDFKDTKFIIQWLVDPSQPVSRLELYDKIKALHPAASTDTLMEELEQLPINIKVQSILRTGGEVWPFIVQQNLYPSLVIVYKQNLATFGSTYLCKAGFSHMKRIKSKDRSRLTDENLQHIIKIVNNSYEPDMEKLASLVQNQVSHKTNENDHEGECD